MENREGESKSTRMLIEANSKVNGNPEILLGLLMSATKIMPGPAGGEEMFGVDEIIGECKAFYFAANNS